ncbi:MAG: hypothetical protein PHN45_05780 [Methylococcales bacterium]|nr:hypothetical protein [Methylococcales bacterium]MDD5754245.1 hypothetical protein [Methylococcales bacterium]
MKNPPPYLIDYLIIKLFTDYNLSNSNTVTLEINMTVPFQINLQ